MALTDLGAGTNNVNPSTTCSLTLLSAINDGETAFFELAIPNTNPTSIALTIAGSAITVTEIARASRTTLITTVMVAYKNSSGSAKASGASVVATWANTGTQNGGGSGLSGKKTDKNIDPTSVAAVGTNNGASSAPTATTSTGPASGSDDYEIVSSVATHTTANPTGPTGWMLESGAVNATRSVTGIGAGKELTAPGTGVQTVTWGSSVASWACTVAMFKVIVATAPTNTVAPAVTGTATVGSTLSTTDGTWTGSPTSFAYQWRRDVGTSGSTWVDIPGATGNTYVVAASDLGSKIRCEIVATNATGSSSPAASNATSVVPAPAGQNTWRVIAGPVAQSDGQHHRLTMTLPALAGDLLVLCTGLSNAALTDGNGNRSDVGIVEDVAGNTWTQDCEAFNDASIAFAGQAFSTHAAAGLAHGDTVTMTVHGMVAADPGTPDTTNNPAGYHGQSPFWFVIAVSTGDSRVLALDGSNHAVDILTSHVAPSITMAHNDGIVIGFHVSGGEGAAGWWTPAAGFTEICDTAGADTLGGETAYNIAGEVQVVSAGYTGGAGGTTGSNKKVTNLVVAYSTAPGGTLTLSAGKAARTATASGVTPRGSGAAPLSVGKAARTATAKGISLLAVGHATLSAGKASRVATAAGITLRIALRLALGKATSVALARGITPRAVGAAPLRPGAASRPAAARGITVTGTGHATLAPGRASRTATARGIRVTGAGHALLTLARVTRLPVVRGVNLILVASGFGYVTATTRNSDAVSAATVSNSDAVTAAAGGDRVSVTVE